MLQKLPDADGTDRGIVFVRDFAVEDDVVHDLSPNHQHNDNEHEAKEAIGMMESQPGQFGYAR